MRRVRKLTRAVPRAGLVDAWSSWEHPHKPTGSGFPLHASRFRVAGTLHSQMEEDDLCE